jgi:hypothetical protein
MYRESGSHRRRQTVVPFIRMSGVWLEQLGFDRGIGSRSLPSMSGSCSPSFATSSPSAYILRNLRMKVFQDDNGNPRCWSEP